MPVAAVTTRQPELLSRSDKQLALTNAIGFAAYYSFGKCLSSNASAAFKTAAAYTGFAIRGLNFLWRQHLIGKLPLAQDHSLVKQAVSPLTATAAQGLALAAASLQEENTALVGWGLCQISPIASAAAVAHHSLQRLGICLRSLPTRPKEAMQAIPIHLLNLAFETGRAITYWQNTTGAQEWREQDRFFEQNLKDPIERDAARFVHAFSNPGWKIAADAAKSQEALDAYLQTMSYTGQQVQNAISSTGSAADLLHSGTVLEEQAKDLAKTSPDLTWQATYKANDAFEAYKAKMNISWYKAWDQWATAQEKGFQIGLDAFGKETSRQLGASKDFSELFRVWGNRRDALQGTCKTEMNSLDAAAYQLLSLDAAHIDKSGHSYQLLRLSKSNIEKACKASQDASETSVSALTVRIRDAWQKKIDAIEKGLVEKAEDLYGRIHPWFVKSSTYVSSFPELLESGQSKIRKIGKDAKASFQGILDAMRKEQQPFAPLTGVSVESRFSPTAKMMMQRALVETKVDQSVNTVQDRCKEIVGKVQQSHDKAYLDRGYTTFGPGWISFKNNGGVVPDSFIHARHVLSQLEPFDELSYKKLNCAYVHEVAQRLSDRGHDVSGAVYDLVCKWFSFEPQDLKFRKKWQEKIDGVERGVIHEVAWKRAEMKGFATAELDQLPVLLKTYQSTLRAFGLDAAKSFQKIRNDVEGSNASTEQQDWVNRRIEVAVRTIQRSCEEDASKIQWAHDQACFDLMHKVGPDVSARAKYILSRLEPFDEATPKKRTCEYVNELAKPLYDLVEWKEKQAVKKAVEDLDCIPLDPGAPQFQKEWQKKINAVEKKIIKEVEELRKVDFALTPVAYRADLLKTQQTSIRKEGADASKSFQAILGEVKKNGSSSERFAWIQKRIDAAVKMIQQGCENAVQKLQLAYDEAMKPKSP